MRPSSLPMLAQCPCWESDSDGQYTESGTARHKYLAAVLSLDVEAMPELGSKLTEDEVSAVHWAADYIRVKAPTSAHEVRLEYHVNPLTDDFLPIFENGGTLDVACGPTLFDLKNRERDYMPQMAAYALGMFQEHGWPEVEVHLLFAETKRALFGTLTEESAHAIVDPIVVAIRSESKAPTPCDYCGWCKNRLTCPALLARVHAVANNREDWSLQQYHVSKIETADEMGKALRLARLIGGWCESVEHHAKEMALKQGQVPAGFKLQSRQGNRYIPNVAAAFPLVGLPQDEFLKVCECKPSALFDAYAKFHGLKKSPAERDVERKLGDVIQRKPSSQSLVAEKK